MSPSWISESISILPKKSSFKKSALKSDFHKIVNYEIVFLFSFTFCFELSRVRSEQNKTVITWKNTDFGQFFKKIKFQKSRTQRHKLLICNAVNKVKLAKELLTASYEQDRWSESIYFIHVNYKFTQSHKQIIRIYITQFFTNIIDHSKE